MKRLLLPFLCIFVLSCNKDLSPGDILSYELSHLEVPNEVKVLKSITEKQMASLVSNKKIEILWSTSKSVKENIYAEF